MWLIENGLLYNTVGSTYYPIVLCVIGKTLVSILFLFNWPMIEDGEDPTWKVYVERKV